MNLLEIGLAFVEGLALIVSPCILPVLPLVLSTSIEGGRRRPYGIIIGFIFSFSAFVLLSRQIVQALHADLDIIKYASLGLLFLLALVMLSEKLSAIFSQWTQRAANFGNTLSQGGDGSLIGGIVIGALIGLVWTPCAGPILAAVLVQVIRQQTNLQGVFVTLAFAVGASVPMFIITIAGRKIMGRLSFFTTHAEAVRKIFGVLMLLSVAYLAFGSSAQSLIATSGTSTGNPAAQDAMTLEDGLEKPYPAPALTGIDAWLNSEPLTIEQLKGKVVLIDFWTYSCINCVRTLPYITSWDVKYRDKGLVIIGVHSPEFEFEKKIENIKTAVEKYGIHYPVAVDSELAIWVAFNNNYWPAHYLIDKNGRVVYTHFGEGKYDVTENNIRYLLGISGKVEKAPEITTVPNFGGTQETYVGSARGANYAGKPALQNGSADFTFPNFIPESNWALNGKWKVETQKITSQSDGASLRFNIKAKKVFLVMGTEDGKPRQITLKLNGAPLGDQAGKDVKDDTVTITGHTLYELLDQKDFRNSLLEITAPAPGVEMYAFTFEN